MVRALAIALLLAAVGVAPAAAAKRKPAPKPASVKVSLPSVGDLTIARVTVQLAALGPRLTPPATSPVKLANGRRLPSRVGALLRMRRISRTKRTAKYHVYVAVPRPVPATTRAAGAALASAPARAAATDRFVRLTFPPGAKRRTLVRGYVEAQDSYAEGGVPDEDICVAYENLPPANQAKTRVLVPLSLGSPAEPATKLFDDSFLASCPDLAQTLGKLSPGFISALTGGVSTPGGGGETRSVTIRAAWGSTIGCQSGAATATLTITNPSPGQSSEYTFSPIFPDCTSPPYDDAALDAVTNLPLDFITFPPSTTYKLVEEPCSAIGNPPDCTKVRLKLTLTNGSSG